MVGDRWTSEENTPQLPAKPGQFRRDVSQAQELIYAHLLEIVKTWPPEDVLAEFKNLFILHANALSSNILPALYEIVFANQEQEFRNTLKRSCYILINNWDLGREHESIKKLLTLFSDPILSRKTISPTLKRLRSWLQNFINSSDFQELKLFAARYEDRAKIHWTERYTSYLLVPQYINLQNPIEQREAARTLSRALKEKFKFDLALYTAHSQAYPSPVQDATFRGRILKNPTALGDEGLRLIKMIVARRGVFSYTNLANIFIKQTHQVSYLDFKQSLQEYLIFSVEQHDFVKALKAQLAEKLDTLYAGHHERPLDDALLLRTVNRVIEYLTTENHTEPSTLFSLLLSQGNPFTLVVVLLKLILICRYARTHLEARIADLIRYYEKVPEADCQWVINFFEIFNITMTIYAENLEFNLVDMTKGRQSTLPRQAQDSSQKPASGLETYRIFSTVRMGDGGSLEAELLETELSESLLSSADLDELSGSAEENV